MFGVDHFYHERVRKSVAVFGSIFNDAYVIRRSGTKVLGQMKVPIAYAPQRKFLERIAEMYQAGNRDLENQTALKLPRMSFEITNMQYDAQRQLPKTNVIKCRGDNPTDGSAHKIYSPVPYIINFELNIYGKQHDDCLQVVEQTLPYFSPQYTVSVKPLPGLSDVIEDVPIILNSVTFSDNFEGTLEDRRIIIYTLSFDMKLNFWGPTCRTPKKVIEQIDIDYFDDTLSTPSYLETQRVETTPRPTDPDSDYSVVLDVLNEHSPDSDFVDPHEVPHPYE